MTSLTKNLEAILELLKGMREDIPDDKLDAHKALSEAIGYLNAMSAMYQTDEEEDRMLNYLIEEGRKAKVMLVEMNEEKKETGAKL